MTQGQPAQAVQSHSPQFRRSAFTFAVFASAVVLAAAWPGVALASSADCTTTPRRFPIQQDPATFAPTSGAPAQPIAPALPPCSTEAPPAAASDSISPALATVLTSMAAQAAVIFVGQVTSVIRENARGYVDVSFHVQSILRGTSASTYVLREWAGLWSWQQDRYYVGEHILLLLRSRSGSGFSSPVGGADGVIPLSGGTEPPILHNGLIPADTTPKPATALKGGNLRVNPSATASAGLAVDLRWIAARAVRTLAYRGAAEEQQGIASSFSPSPPSESGELPGHAPPLTPVSLAAPNNSEGSVALATVLALIAKAPEVVVDAH